MVNKNLVRLGLHDLVRVRTAITNFNQYAQNLRLITYGPEMNSILSQSGSGCYGTVKPYTFVFEDNHDLFCRTVSELPNLKMGLAEDYYAGFKTYYIDTVACEVELTFFVVVLPKSLGFKLEMNEVGSQHTYPVLTVGTMAHLVCVTEDIKCAHRNFKYYSKNLDLTCNVSGANIVKLRKLLDPILSNYTTRFSGPGLVEDGRYVVNAEEKTVLGITSDAMANYTRSFGVRPVYGNSYFIEPGAKIIIETEEVGYSLFPTTVKEQRKFRMTSDGTLRMIGFDDNSSPPIQKESILSLVYRRLLEALTFDNCVDTIEYAENNSLLILSSVSHYDDWKGLEEVRSRKYFVVDLDGNKEVRGLTEITYKDFIANKEPVVSIGYEHCYIDIVVHEEPVKGDDPSLKTIFLKHVNDTASWLDLRPYGDGSEQLFDLQVLFADKKRYGMLDPEA